MPMKWFIIILSPLNYMHVCNQTDFVDHNVLSVYQPYNSPSINLISLKYYVLSEYDQEHMKGRSVHLELLKIK